MTAIEDFNLAQESVEQIRAAKDEYSDEKVYLRDLKSAELLLSKAEKKLNG